MGLVSRLAGLLGGGSSAKVAPPGPRQHLAFVLLDAPAPPSGEEVVAAFREIAPATEPSLAVDPPSEAGNLQLTLGKGGSLLVALLPLPVPNGEADAAFAYSFSAGLASDAGLAPHRAHLIALFKDEPGRSRSEELTRFTHLLAAVAQASRALAVYWGDSGATHDAGFLVDRARTRDPDLMLPVWCGFEMVEEGPGRVSMLTVGMRRQLGMMELRVTAPRQNVGEHVGAMFDLLAYAARRGSPVPDGDTVGRNADERLKVRYERSPVDPEEKVWRVDFP